MSITPNAFDDGSRCLSSLELYKLDDFIAITFLNGHSSAEVLYLKIQTPGCICIGVLDANMTQISNLFS